jgi:hypothetical protein
VQKQLEPKIAAPSQRLFSQNGGTAQMKQGCQMVYFQTKNHNWGKF